MFRKILIANRGEIACRIIKTAHKMGIECVAVYSEADANARHVALADEAFLLGGAASTDSYLRADKILAIAKQSGAQAIHPGYGFLSENSDFAAACAANNLVFIGPPAAAIAAMGSKSAAKTIMAAAGVPLVPGYHGDDQSLARLKQAAHDCGFPVLLKAVAGGGGKGMRVVREPSEFTHALAAAKREALNAFGNGDMLVERYLTQPRHIEIQVFCDQHGHSLYLGDRDCSIQRRHQKVLEEAPAPGLSQATREAMGHAAVRAAQAIDYVGAGTVEFLYDVDGTFFFMEMNTRLQVEHPVTEMITGQDLVEWQLRIAAGHALPIQQEQLTLQGHAIEVRIYAEDPAKDFLPVTGTLQFLNTPVESAHVRVDTGVQSGDHIGVHYDPMMAKLIVWDHDRDAAIRRLQRALADYQLQGLTTNRRFLLAISQTPAFQAAQLDTSFIEKHYQQLFPEPSLSLVQRLGFASAYLALQKQEPSLQTPFQYHTAWRLNHQGVQRYRLQDQGQWYDVDLGYWHEQWQLIFEGVPYSFDAELQGAQLTLHFQGQRYRMQVRQHGSQLVLFYAGDSLILDVYQANFDSTDQAQNGSLQAPMNGAVVAIHTQVGQTVVTGQTLVIMEAMKMEHAIKAPYAGEVSAIFYQVGELVADGAALLALTPATIALEHAK